MTPMTEMISGLSRLATRPVPTGSPAVEKTIGMIDVACLTAATCGVPDVTMTLTLRRTNSAAISAARWLLPSAQRYSITTVRPSIQPSSRSRCVKAATHSLAAESVVWPKKTDNRKFCRLLRTRGSKPRDGSDTNHFDEIAPSHCRPAAQDGAKVAH